MDTAVLCQENQRLKEQNVLLQASLDSLKKNYESEIATQKFFIERLQFQISKLLRRNYGKKTEHLQGKQLSLFGDDEEKPIIEEPVKETITYTRKKKPRKGARNLPENLPRERKEYDLSEEDKNCKKCGGKLHRIGEEKLEQLEYIPAKLKVIEHVKFKYGCRNCEDTVITTEMPHQPIAKGFAGPKLLAQIIVSKYEDHIPLHRQERVFARHGIEISKSTLCDWIMQSANLLKPLVDKLKERLLKAPKIHTDDTPILVQTEQESNIKTGRLWVYIGCGRYGPPCTVYEYSENREQRWPKEFLRGYAGYLQADAYAGYDQIYAQGKIKEVGCFAHARRKFYDIIKQNPKATHAQQALEYIQKLYAIETEAKYCTHKKRKKLRLKKAKPILEGFRKWLGDNQEAFSAKSPISQAINYSINHWQAFTRYLESGMLEIDNNRAERAIKPIALGRKNWLFAGSDRGAKAAAIIYSLIETCKQNLINPYEYLADVLAKLPEWKITKIEELLPCNWKNPIC